jgi:hypothetical protein
MSASGWTTDAWPTPELWEHGPRFFRGLRVRLAATFAIVVGAVVWIVYYALFWAGHFAWYANLAVLFATFLVAPIAIVAMWVAWAIGLHRRFWMMHPGDAFGPFDDW